MCNSEQQLCVDESTTMPPRPHGQSHCARERRSDDQSSGSEKDGMIDRSCSITLQRRGRGRFVLCCTVRMRPSPLGTQNPGSETAFDCPVSEEIEKFEVRSNAIHSIHRRAVFGQWRIGLCSVRPVACFQVPILILEDRQVDVIPYVNGKPIAHITVNIAETGAEQSQWVCRETIEESMLQGPDPANDVPTQACRGLYLWQQQQKQQQQEQQQVEEEEEQLQTTFLLDCVRDAKITESSFILCRRT